MNNIQTLKQYINEGFVNEDQAKIFVDLLNGNLQNCKGHFIQTVYNRTEQRKVDSAFPIGISDQIRDAGLTYNKQPNFCYSYIDNKFGELVNLDRLFLSKLFSYFPSSY